MTILYYNMNPDLFNTSEGIATVLKSQEARYASTLSVTLITDLMELRKKYRHVYEGNKATVNKLKAQIGPLMKAQAAAKKNGSVFDTTELNKLLDQKERLDILIEKDEPAVKEVEEMLKRQLDGMGNIVDSSVPISNDEANNRVEKVWGPQHPIDKFPLHHSEVMQKLGAYKDGSVVAGQRGYFLTGPGLLVNMALINYGIDFLRKKGYQPTGTPMFMTQNAMSKTAQLSDYDDQLYKIVDKVHEPLYLIATSEQPISAMYMSGTNSPAFIDTNLLPMRMAGFSSCFRKEAGKSGKDMRGLFRLHQFEKVEQFCIVAPESSEEEHQKMLSISEEFYQSLGLSYRVVNIVSGALNDAASKKYDIEAWFPNTQEFRELVSCSNCSDFQSRKLNIRYGYNTQDAKSPFVHMLNSTLIATERAMCCLMENYQTEKGFNVPKVLQPYCYNIEKFDFVV